MNSFLQLNAQETGHFIEKYQDDVRHEVASRLKTVHLISDVLEHFLPRLSDTMTVMLGGDVISPEDIYLTIDEKQLPPPAPGRDNDNDVIR